MIAFSGSYHGNASELCAPSESYSGGCGLSGRGSAGAGEVLLAPNYHDPAALEQCRALAESGRVAAVIVEPGSWLRGGIAAEIKGCPRKGALEVGSGRTVVSERELANL